jgi:hypothetical protein
VPIYARVVCLLCVRIGLLDEYNTKHRNIGISLNLKIIASLFHVCTDQ